MKSENLLDLIGDADDSMIEEAKKKKKTAASRWATWAAIAACFCIAIAGTIQVAYPGMGKPALEAGDKTPTHGAVGLYVPAVELPEDTEGVEFDMLALVVYKGGIYTQAECYHDGEAEKIDDLVGTYLGYATGSINEWSTQDEYAEEFASSIAGEVYEVQGYDPDFRICIRSEYENEAGEKCLWIQFLDRLNGITIQTGTDLFETRLHLSDRLAAIRYENHDDWDEAKNNLRTADIEEHLWKEFLNQADNAEFIYTWEPGISSNTIYDNPNQAHLTLKMEDGTCVSIRLIEGGYVGYDSMPWYFVQIPGDTFDAVFAACGGNVS